MFLKKTALLAIIITVSIIIMELLAESVLYWKAIKSDFPQWNHRISGASYALDILGQKAYRRLTKQGYEPFVHTVPTPFFTPDPSLGYRVQPGVYQFLFNERYPIRLVETTMTAAGTRRVGYQEVNADRRLMIYGDSYVFGLGVHDQATFAWLLQHRLGENMQVINYAMNGYGPVQEYLQVEAQRETLRPEDRLIIGYADFYKGRTVAAPGLLRSFNATGALEKHLNKMYSYPYAELDERGELMIKSVNMDCRFSQGWCERASPEVSEQERITIALYDAMTKELDGRIAIAWLMGADTDPVIVHLREKGVPLIDLRPENGIMYKDTIGAVDRHPGPLTHHSFYVKIWDFMTEKGWNNNTSE